MFEKEIAEIKKGCGKDYIQNEYGSATCGEDKWHLCDECQAKLKELNNPGKEFKCLICKEEIKEDEPCKCMRNYQSHQLATQKVENEVRPQTDIVGDTSIPTKQSVFNTIQKDSNKCIIQNTSEPNLCNKVVIQNDITKAMKQEITSKLDITNSKLEVKSEQEVTQDEFITGHVKILHDYEFHEIDCMTDDEDTIGFFGYYNGDLNHPDYRPSSAIYLKELDAEYLYRLFTNKAISNFAEKIKSRIKDKQNQLDNNFSYSDSVMGSEECINIIDKLVLEETKK